MLVTCEEMRAAEEAVFATGVSADSLMERAGLGMAGAVRQFFPVPGRLVIFAGKGHNAGDALVAARHLAGDGWEIAVRFAFSVQELRPLTAAKWKALEGLARVEPVNANMAGRGTRTVVMDGLLGIGAGGGLRGGIRDACLAVNRLRREGLASIIAIDIPTGLDGNSGAADPAAVVADFTFTVAAAKRGLVADCAINHVGRIVLIPLEELEPAAAAAAGRGTGIADARSARALLPVRDFDTHKGKAGRVGILAGSAGMSGAARLAATAALHAGAGLVTLLVPRDVWAQLAVACPPEIMVRPVEDCACLADLPFDALGIGPGLGAGIPDGVFELMLSHRAPAVLDADALNAIARRGVHCLDSVTSPRLLTPHPGEMERLQPAAGRSREQQVTAFADAFPVSILLKGARTLVASRGRPVSCNTTGNPGMGTGGMGDTLTGICAALLAQGLHPHDAGVAGSWLLGRAAEIAVANGRASEESLTASTVAEHLGAAFAGCRNGDY